MTDSTTYVLQAHLADGGPWQDYAVDVDAFSDHGERARILLHYRSQLDAPDAPRVYDDYRFVARHTHVLADTSPMLPPGGQARWFPQMPPKAAGETDAAYTGRLLAIPGPYDHQRNRQCSIGWHPECSEAGKADLMDGTCRCPCHTPEGQLELRLAALEEMLVAVAGHVPVPMAPNIEATLEAIITAHPQYAEWYPRHVPQVGDQS